MIGIIVINGFTIEIVIQTVSDVSIEIKDLMVITILFNNIKS